MVRQIDVNELKALLDGGGNVWLLDVRQPWEHALVALPQSTLIPLDQLGRRASEVVPGEGGLVVAYCHHGVRSLHAAQLLSLQGIEAVSLAGGIDRWSSEIDPALPRY